MTWSAPRALIDETALRHNLAMARHYAPQSRIWAVIKANAYGHGSEAVARLLAAADGFAVARVEEGVHLREAGISQPILVLEGMVFADELEAAARHALTLTLHHRTQAQLLVNTSRRLVSAPSCWLKVDTGMHRLGFRPEEVPNVIALLEHPTTRARIAGLMTHLANADMPADPMSARQCSRLQETANGLDLPLSIGNSAGLIALPSARSAWVRPGIMLYGASPFATGLGKDLGLMPVMTLQARLIAVQTLGRGAAVGYGGAYICPEAMPVGIIGIGYGDGYPRHAKTGTPVLLNGQRVPLIGRVSMDMIHVDLRTQPQAAIGDRATLWGAALPVEEIASWAETIPYELLCHIAQRVEMRYQARVADELAA